MTDHGIMTSDDYLRVRVAAQIVSSLVVAVKTEADAHRVVPYSVKLADALIAEVVKTSGNSIDRSTENS